MRVWEYVARNFCSCILKNGNIDELIRQNPSSVSKEVHYLLVENGVSKEQLIRLLPLEIQKQIKGKYIADILVQDVNYFIPKVIKGRGENQITLDELVGQVKEDGFRPKVIK